jgi:hypothetical protein
LSVDLASERGAIAASCRQLPGQRRQHRIEAQLVVVDQVLVTQRDGKHPLTDQRRQRMFHQVGATVVAEAAGQPLDQADRLVGRPQQQRARIRGHPPAVKRRDHPPAFDASKIEQPWITLRPHRGPPSRWFKSVSQNNFYH